MTHRSDTSGTISRLKSGVRTMTTRLRNLPVNKTRTARSEAIIQEQPFQVRIRVLAPTTPPSPPPGALIAEKNWPRPFVHRRHPQPACSPIVESRKLPARGTKSTEVVELGSIVEDDVPFGMEGSSGSEVDTASTGLGSYSTNVTGNEPSLEEGAISVEGKAAAQVGSGEAIRQEELNHTTAGSSKSNEIFINGDMPAIQNDDLEVR